MIYVQYEEKKFLKRLSREIDLAVDDMYGG
jgi:hypothetical protein